MKFFFGKGVWASKRARRIIGDKSRQDIRSVAVIRHAALGDMVLTRCLLREIRTFFPNASLTLSLVSHFTYGAPTDQVDRVHVLHAGGQRDVSLLERLHGIRELGYHDILFDVAATNRSMKVCLLNSAWLKVGFPYHAWQRQLIYDVSVPRSDLQFEADTMLNMLNALGCQTDYPPRFDLPAAPAGRGKPYVVYFTGAAVPDKCWPALHFTRLIALMAAEYPDCEHVVLEGINDWESIAPIIGPLRPHANVIGLKGDSIDTTIALVAGARLVVANDTGVRNLAIAADTPSVGIFFSTWPFRYWPRCGPHAVVFDSDGSVPDVESVLAAARKLMD